MYDQIFTMHGMTMIFWYASPILSGFAIFLIPLMIGARDLAFPRLNAFTYWTFLFSGVLLYSAPFLGQSPHAGWFAYVPYTNAHYSPGLRNGFLQSGADPADHFDHRRRDQLHRHHSAPARAGDDRQPDAAVPLQHADDVVRQCLCAARADRGQRLAGTRPAAGTRTSSMWRTAATPLLWQQVFWFFGHPWVYIIFLPATGMISMIMPVFSRRPIVGYPYVAFVHGADRPGGVRRLGSPHVRHRHVPRWR